jgi:hypothetical protein
MIIELGSIHARWKLLKEGTCMLLANENETMRNGMGFRMYGHVTNKGETNYMGGRDIAKLM